MEKLRDASTNRYSSVMSTVKKGYSPLLERINLSDPQSKKNENQINAVDKAKLGDTILNSSKPSTHPNVELTMPTSSELPSYIFRENIMMKETDQKEYQEQTSHGVRPSYADLLHGYSDPQWIPEMSNGTKVNSTEARSESIAEKNLYASRNPLIFLNQIMADSQQPQEKQLPSIYQDHLHHIALTHEIQTEEIPSLRTFLLDTPKPLTRNQNIKLNISSVIQNLKNKPNKPSQLDISKSSLVNKDHPRVSSPQKQPGQSSEVECAISKPSSHSEMMNASYAVVGGSTSAKHQDLSIEKMVVDEPSEVSCVKQNVLSERKAGNKSSAISNIFENASYLGQSAVKSMEEGLLINDKIMSDDVSSKQDVDNDERNTSPEISSEEILTASPNLNVQVDQSVDSVLNEADVLANQLFDLVQRMKVDFVQSCQIAHDLHKSLVQSHTVIECIANASKNLRESTKGKITIVTKKVTVEVQPISKENEAEKKGEENPDVNMKENVKDDNDEDFEVCKTDDDDDDDDDDDHVVDDDDDVVDDDRDTKVDNNNDRDDKILKTTRGHIRTFVLPPEYDPDDTRWTLKYRKRDPKLNLIELVPHSNVFINSIKLAHCKRVSKDSKTLARMLLVEIFSQIALSVCSLTGARSNVFDITGTNVRPGLDEPARMTILSYVEEHALKKKWGAFDLQTVLNSLRSKIQEVRAKHGKTA